MTRLIIGVDPGVTTGVGVLDVDTLHWEILQLSPGVVLPVLSALAPTGELLAVAVEKFVVGPRAGRSSSPQAGQTTRSLVGSVSALGQALGARVVARPAVEVKRWATKQRLVAAGVPQPAGMGHALDGCRHALFEAVFSGLLPDPLSKRWPRR